MKGIDNIAQKAQELKQSGMNNKEIAKELHLSENTVVWLLTKRAKNLSPLSESENNENQIRLEEERKKQEAEEEANRKAEEEKQRLIEEAIKENEKLITKIISLEVPQFMDTGTAHEIIVFLKNTSSDVLKDISLDLSDFNEYFNIEGEINLNTLKPGMEIEESLKIKPKFKKGVFVVKMKYGVAGHWFEKEYTIKVGGTEIY